MQSKRRILLAQRQTAAMQKTAEQSTQTTGDSTNTSPSKSGFTKAEPFSFNTTTTNTGSMDSSTFGTPSTSKSLFGENTSTSQSPFGATTTSKDSPFGNKSLFGAFGSTSQSPFGGTANTSTQSPFGTPTTSAAKTPQPLFGGPIISPKADLTEKSIFGTPPTGTHPSRGFGASASPFDNVFKPMNSATTTTQSTLSFGGSSSFGTPGTQALGFGGIPATQPISSFGSKPAFGAPVTYSFGMNSTSTSNGHTATPSAFGFGSVTTKPCITAFGAPTSSVSFGTPPKTMTVPTTTSNPADAFKSSFTNVPIIETKNNYSMPLCAGYFSTIPIRSGCPSPFQSFGRATCGGLPELSGTKKYKFQQVYINEPIGQSGYMKCISSMSVYSDKSLEELRLDDYLSGDKMKAKFPFSASGDTVTFKPFPISIKNPFENIIFKDGPFSQAKTGNSNLFFKLKAKNEGEFISPFALARFMKKEFEDVGKVSSLHSGAYLIEAKNCSQEEKLPNIIEIDGVAVQCSLNTTSYVGVFRCPNLNYIKDEDIVAELKDQGVIGMERILRKGKATPNEQGRRKGLCNTGSFKLFFERGPLPEKIEIGLESYKVEKAQRVPLQCYRCFTFGHISSKCKRKLCTKCYQILQNGSYCDHFVVCPNCKLPHRGNSRDCPVLEKETGICKVMTDQNLSYLEAKKVYEAQNKRSPNYQSNELNARLDRVANLMEQQQFTITKILATLLDRFDEKNKFVFNRPVGTVSEDVEVINENDSDSQDQFEVISPTN